MAASPAKVHDPLFHFETHFPERLSRLHLQSEFSHSVRRARKPRAARVGARYRTQPVTFDEIQEVDEEAPSAAADEKNKSPGVEVGAGAGGGLKNQFQAFSRSMDGLVPKAGKAGKLPPGTAATVEDRLPPSPSLKPAAGLPPKIPEKAEQRLQEPPSPTTAAAASGSSSSSREEGGPGKDALAPPPGASGGEQGPSPIPSPNMAPRRQKVTAKAKKRQKAVGEPEGEQAS